MVNNDGREVVLDAVVGQKRQPKFNTSRKTGEKWPNPFWYEQGGQKALRNAKQKLIPEPIKLALIDAYSKAGKTKQIGTGDLSTTKSPPPDRPRAATAPPLSAEQQATIRRATIAEHTRLVQKHRDLGLGEPSTLGPGPDGKISTQDIAASNAQILDAIQRAEAAIEAANAEAEQMALASEETQP